jgi:hypothetical protein
VPGAAFGNMVDHLPEDLRQLYQETRNCMILPAYTSAVLTCRKILMHIAVDRGATVGQPFQAYVTYLITSNTIPPHFQTWVDAIRQRGNEANHEIVLMRQADAETLLSFTEMLLKLLYEFPHRASLPPARP